MNNTINKEKLLKIIAPLIFIIFGMNFVANKFYWYSSIWYFDMPMHFLGGAWLSFALIWLFPPKEMSFKYIFKVLLGVLLVGLGWEIFEILVNHFTIQNLFNVLDTSSDICFDLGGGSLALLYFFKKIMVMEKSAV
ncbi:MAG: hypothetical protein V4439_03905 [Patescibacteria group bacterium]